LALPVAQISLVAGLVDTFRRIFGSTPMGGALVMMLGLMVLFSFVANMVTWTLSANRSAAEAAKRGDLPAFFGRFHPRFKTPVSSAIFSGLLASFVVLVYGLLAKTAEELFWTTFAFSSVVFLLPYLLLFLAFLKLRRIAPDTASGELASTRPQPYRVPGGYAVAVVLSVVCMVFITQSIVFFVVKPGAYDANYALAVLTGVCITIAVGEVLVRYARKRAGALAVGGTNA
jgi:glutamate:GABA antiporter